MTCGLLRIVVALVVILSIARRERNVVVLVLEAVPHDSRDDSP